MALRSISSKFHQTVGTSDDSTTETNSFRKRECEWQVRKFNVSPSPIPTEKLLNLSQFLCIIFCCCFSPPLSHIVMGIISQPFEAFALKSLNFQFLCLCRPYICFINWNGEGRGVSTLSTFLSSF